MLLIGFEVLVEMHALVSERARVLGWAGRAATHAWHVPRSLACVSRRAGRAAVRAAWAQGWIEWPERLRQLFAPEPSLRGNAAEKAS